MISVAVVLNGGGDMFDERFLGKEMILIIILLKIKVRTVVGVWEKCSIFAQDVVELENIKIIETA